MRNTLRKSYYILSLLAVVLISFIASSNEVKAAEICTRVDVTSIPVYRAYFDFNGEHLYTTDRSEIDNLIANEGWIDEGVSWYSPKVGTPVYRLYNALGAKDHLYTTDLAEVETLVSQGWVKDNLGEPFFFSDGDIPIYRVFKQDTGAHHLTKDLNEYETLTQNGWTGEGEAFRSSEENYTIDYPMGYWNIENVPATYAIEADVSLSGFGSGYHAKIDLLDPLSGVSFGIQCDNLANQGYKDSANFLVENVMSNYNGEQEYTHVNLAATNTTFRMMLALETNGTIHYYVNGTELGTTYNPNLVNKDVTPRVEGSAKHNGDRVDAYFNNIKIKKGDTYDPDKVWSIGVADTNRGLHSNISRYESDRFIYISGTLMGIGAGSDWDSDFNSVSGNAGFYDYSNQ